eukprot:gene41160-50943_t
MSTITEILARARGRDAALPYAGAVTPAEAYALLRADSADELSRLLDHAPTETAQIVNLWQR